MTEGWFCPNAHPLTDDALRFCPACGVAVACAQGHRIQGGPAAFCEDCGEPFASASSMPRAGGSPASRTVLAVAVAAAFVILGVVAVILLAQRGDDDRTPSSAVSTAGPERPRRVGSGTPSAADSRGTNEASTSAPGAPPTPQTAQPGTAAPAASSPASSAPTSAAAGQPTVAQPTATPQPAAPIATPVPPTPIPPAPNLASNGGFETGALSAPWGTGIYEPRAQGVFWGAADADAAVVSDAPHGGSYALKIVNRSAAAPNVYRTLSQKVPVQGGVPHCLTFWERTQSGTSGMLTFRLNDSWSSAIGIGAGSASWAQRAFSFTTEDGNIDLRIVSENTGTVWVDDIVLTVGACNVPNGLVPSGANPR